MHMIFARDSANFMLSARAFDYVSNNTTRPSKPRSYTRDYALFAGPLAGYEEDLEWLVSITNSCFSLFPF